MKSNYAIALTLMLITTFGCSTIPTTAKDLMIKPNTEIIEVAKTTKVTPTVAYRNILNRARQCWTNPFYIENDPFDHELGFARITVRSQDSLLTPTHVVSVVEIHHSPQGGSDIKARAIKWHGIFLAISDLNRIQSIAEGKIDRCYDE